MKRLLLLGALLSGWIGMHAQGLVPQPIPCFEPKVYTPGYIPGSMPELKFENYSCVDLYGPIAAGGPNVIEKGHTDIVGGKYVHFGPGVHIGPMVDSVPPYTPGHYMHAYIGTNNFDVVWFEPNSTPGEVGQYEKLELGVKLPSPIDSMVYNYVHHGMTTEWLNPFDSAQVRVEAVFHHLTGYAEEEIDITRSVDGFYYREYIQPAMADSNWTEDTTSYPFRIRFSPNILGNWSVSIKIYTPLGTYEILPIHFKCTSSDNPGNVFIGPYKHFFLLGNDPYYPIGQNLPWPWGDSLHHEWEDGLYTRGIHFPSVFMSYRQLISEFKSAGGNAFRLLISPWTFEVEFEELGNYSNRMKHAWELDRVIELADSLGLKIEFNLQLHSDFENGSTFSLKNWDWKANTCGTDAAYAYATDLGLTGIQDFYTNTNAKTNYRNRLRYLISRYNYSTSIMAYEIMSEINNMGKEEYYNPTTCIASGHDYSNPYHEDPDFANAAGNWVEEMAGYIKYSLGATDHLISTSYAGSPFNPPTGTVMDGGTLYSAFQNGDNSIKSDNFDIGSFNNYGVNVSFPTGTVNSVMDYGYGTGSAYNNINKPVIHSEFGQADDYLTKCDNDVEYIKNIYITPFTGAALAFQWKHFTSSELYHHYGNVARFINSMLALNNIAVDYWEPTYATINGGGTPQVEYYSLKNGISDVDHLFGIVINRTYNAVSEYESNPSLFLGTHCSSYMTDEDSVTLTAYPNALRSKISIADIDGDHTLELLSVNPDNYIVEWYNPFYGNMVKWDGALSTILGHKIELDFPDLNLVEDADSDGILDSTFLPYVFFYVYPVGDRSTRMETVNSDYTRKYPNKVWNCQLYPNPVNTFSPININCVNAIKKIELYNGNGQFLHNFTELQNVLTLPPLQRGVYYVKITTYDNSEENYKLVVLD